jgi:acetoin utilization deacetylase AcuC-like enzyme
MTGELMNQAHQTAQDRILVALEGGYNLLGLRDGVRSVLLTLSGQGSEAPAKLSASASLLRELAPVFKVQKEYWQVAG